MSLGVEMGGGLGNSSCLVVFVHLRKRIAVQMELLAGHFPPDWEVLAHRAAQVRAVRCGLRHQLVERFAGALPVRALHAHERGEYDGGGEAEHPPVRGRADDRAHEGESHEPAEGAVSNGLPTHLLKLREVEFLHAKDFPFSQVVVLENNRYSFSGGGASKLTSR